MDIYTCSAEITIGDTAEWDCRVTGTYHRAVRAYTPRGEYAPIDPPEPSAFEIDKIEIAPAGTVEYRDLPGWLVTEEQRRELERCALAEIEDRF